MPQTLLLVLEIRTENLSLLFLSLSLSHFLFLCISFIFSVDARQYYVQSSTIHSRSFSSCVRLQSVCGIDR